MPKSHERRRQNREHDARRRSESATRKLYSTSRWRRFSRAFLAREENALCVDCVAEGVARASEVTDHDPPHRGDVERFWSGPFVGRCRDHHDRHKQRLEARGYSDALDDDGWPSDDAHPANATSKGGRSRTLQPFAPRPAAPLNANSREIAPGQGGGA